MLSTTTLPGCYYGKAASNTIFVAMLNPAFRVAATYIFVAANTDW
jgi:hypothetical protein